MAMLAGIEKKIAVEIKTLPLAEKERREFYREARKTN